MSQLVNLREAITAEEAQKIQVLEGEINVVSSAAEIEVTKILSEAEKQAQILDAQAQADGDVMVYESLVSTNTID